MEEMAIESNDVIRLILQFLKENQLFNAMNALQEESQVSLNTVDSIDTFINDISSGKWDNVLLQTSSLQCSSIIMMDLYELIVLEMIEASEIDVVKAMIENTAPFIMMKQIQLERWNHLKYLLQHTPQDTTSLYGSRSKQQRREDLCQQFRNELSSAPPSRLLTLLGQALKWQASQGLLQDTTNYDLFQGASKVQRIDRSEKIVKKSAGKIKFSKSSGVLSVVFSSDGNMLLTGAKDGFIEVWDVDKCQLRKDLPYQAREEFMMHDSSVTALTLSRNGDLLASGSSDGKIKVWKLSSGVCLRRFDQAHVPNGIQSLCFSRDGTQVVSSAFSPVFRIHGLKSGQLLKEFIGHDQFVNETVFSRDGRQVLSVSSDGTLKLWDVRTADCLMTILPPETDENNKFSSEIDVTNVHQLQNEMEEQAVICTRTSFMYRVSLTTGQCLQTYRADESAKFACTSVGNFVTSTISSKFKWLYGVTEKGFLLTFKLDTGELDAVLQISNGDQSFGLIHHPYRNLVATYGSDRCVRMWKA